MLGFSPSEGNKESAERNNMMPTLSTKMPANVNSNSINQNTLRQMMVKSKQLRIQEPTKVILPPREYRII